jgi:hypothetical protein
LFVDTSAPTVLEIYPETGTSQADMNTIPLVLFSEPVKESTLATGLTLTKTGTTDPVAGTYVIAGNAVAFVPAVGLTPGQQYRFRVLTSVRDYADNPLLSASEVTFTVATDALAAAPVLDPMPSVTCAQTLRIEGAAAPQAQIRVVDGSLTSTGNAGADGRFAIEIPVSGNGYHEIRVYAVTAQGDAGPQARVLVRIDCTAPSVTSASLDRNTGTVYVTFSEAMNGQTLAAGGPNDSIRLSDAEDGTRTAQTAAVTLDAVQTAATLQLSTAQNAWWRTKPVRLEVRPPAADVKGNRVSGTYETVFYLGGGPGDLLGSFLAGEVYSESTGRPLAGATAKLFVSGASLPGSVPVANVTVPVSAQATDGRGRYSMAGDVVAGRYAVVLEKSGYTRAIRRMALEPSTGAVPFDARLTPLSVSTSLTITSGGTFNGPTGSLITLEVPPNGIPASGTVGVSLTPLSGQGLPELLPLGWSPLVAAHIHVEANGEALPEGTATPFVGNSVELTLPLPAAAGATLYAVRHDITSGTWITLGAITRTTGSDGIERARFALLGPGSVVVVIPDEDALTRPPIPSQAGSALVGSSLPAQLPSLTGTLTLDPPQVAPAGKSRARVEAHSTDNTAWPSGLAVQAYLDEKLILSDGSELYESPFSTDLVLYHTSGVFNSIPSPRVSGERVPEGGVRGPHPLAVPAATGLLDFIVSPSPKAAEVILQTGYDNIRLYPYTAPLERGSVLGPSGGTVTSTEGIELTLPEGTLTQQTVVTVRYLTATELQGLTPPLGFQVLTGVRIEAAGRTLARPATLTLKTPANTPADPQGEPRIVLAQWQAQPIDGRGAFAKVVNRGERIASQGSNPEKLRFAPEPTNSALPLAGITQEGVYLILRADAAIGYATGFVKAESGIGYFDARVTAAGLGTADLSLPGGRYAIPVPSGTAKTIEARHPSLDERGTATIASMAPNAVVSQDITIRPQGPTILSVQPVNNAQEQPIGSVIRIQFSEPLDPTSVNASLVRIEIANAAGTSTGLEVLGTVTLASNGTQLLFTPARALPPGRVILCTFLGGVRDAGGTLYAGAVPYTWSFPTSTDVTWGGQVNPSKIRILVPQNGTAQIIGEAGALPLSQSTPWAVKPDVEGLACPSVTTTQANTQGGFSLTAGCPPTNSLTLSSIVWLKVFDPTGTLAATIKLGPFTTPDGKGFVARAGEETSYTTPEGIQVTVPAEAFGDAKLVTLTQVAPSSITAPMNPGLEVGAAVRVEFDGFAYKSLRVKVPLPATAIPGRLVFVGEPVTLSWGERLSLIDLARVVDGGNGTRLASNLVADQPADPPSGVKSGIGLLNLGTPTTNPHCLSKLPCAPICKDAPPAPGCDASVTTLPAQGCAACACSTFVCTALAEMNSARTAVFVHSTMVELSAFIGNATPAGFGQQYSVLYSTMADTFVYVPEPNNWKGNYILPALKGVAFSVIQRDKALGWVTREWQFGPLTGNLQLVELPPPAGDLKEPPRPAVLLESSVADVMLFKGELPGDGQNSSCRTLRLEMQACTDKNGVVTLQPFVFPLAAGTRVELLSWKERAEPDWVTGWEEQRNTRVEVSAGNPLPPVVLSGGVGLQLAAVVSEMKREPVDSPNLVFRFSQPVKALAGLNSMIAFDD